MTEIQRSNDPRQSVASFVPIILSGLATSALTFIFVGAIADTINMMGLYLLFIVPVGAILVGLGAGSGYGLASWKTGARIGKALLAIVVVLQVSSYFVAQYVQFRGLAAELAVEGIEVGFWTYFDFNTRAFAFEESSPMGGVGYLFRVLEIIGFVLGGVIAPVVLRSKAYCDSCQRYMKTRQIAWIPGGVMPPSRWRKSDEAKESHAAAMDEAWQAGLESLASLQQKSAEGDVSGVQALLFDFSEHKKATLKLPLRVVVSLTGCTRCGDGFLLAQSHAGQGEGIAITELSSTVAHTDVVKKILD